MARKQPKTNRRRLNPLTTETLEARWCPASSLGWDGPGRGEAELSFYVGSVPSGLNQQTVESTLLRAMDVWGDVADIQFSRTNIAGQRDSIDFSFRNLDGAGGTLAQAYFPDDVNPSRIAGDVQFDSSESWEVGNTRGNSAFDLLWVAVHEIGHALGLDHAAARGAVMNDTVSAGTSFSALASADRQAILALYAASDSDSGVTNTPTTSNTNTNTNTNTNSNPWTTSQGFGWGWWWRFSGYRGRVSSDALIADSGRNNADNPEDVNEDDAVTPIDALSVVNRLNRHSTDATNDLLRLSVMVGRLSDQPGCLDNNEDGLLSEEEVPEKLWMRISAADEDGDESLSSAELSSYRLKLLDEYFAGRDANADGSLSEDEVPAKVWRRLATIDADESETISLEELAAFSPSFHSGGIGGHQHHHA